MKRILLFSSIILSSLSFAQSNNDLKTEMEQIKRDITNLKAEIQSVKSENIYLKKSLEINTPILEQKNNNNEYRITGVEGNKKDKLITISFLIVARDENKTSFLQDFSIIDINGDQYKPDLIKSSNTLPKLTANIPLKIKVTFKDIVDEPKILKLFKFSTRNESEKNPANFNRSNQEFKDLNVTWK